MRIGMDEILVLRDGSYVYTSVKDMQHGDKFRVSGYPYTYFSCDGVYFDDEEDCYYVKSGGNAFHEVLVCNVVSNPKASMDTSMENEFLLFNHFLGGD